MLQIIDIENKELFVQVSWEESSTVNGGANGNTSAALQGANAIAVFLAANAGAGLTPAQAVLASIVTITTTTTATTTA